MDFCLTSFISWRIWVKDTLLSCFFPLDYSPQRGLTHSEPEVTTMSAAQTSTSIQFTEGPLLSIYLPAGLGARQLCGKLGQNGARWLTQEMHQEA